VKELKEVGMMTEQASLPPEWNPVKELKVIDERVNFETPMGPVESGEGIERKCAISDISAKRPKPVESGEGIES